MVEIFENMPRGIGISVEDAGIRVKGDSTTKFSVSQAGAVTMTTVVLAGGTANLPIQIGAFSSTTGGYGVLVSDANKRAVDIHTDDGGVGTGGGAFISNTRMRLLCTGTTYLGEQYSAHGLSKFVGSTIASYAAGILGALEWATSLTVSGYAAGIMGRIGGGAVAPAVTGILAAFIAVNNMTADHTGAGATAGFATIIASTKNWDFGLYIPNNSVDMGIKIMGGAAKIKGIFVGDDANTAGSAIHLDGSSWDTAQANGFYADDGGSALVGYTECFTARMLMTATVASGDVSTAAMHPDLTINASYTGIGGLSAIWGNTTIMTGKTVDVSGGHGDVGGGTFGLDLVGTLAAGSFGCGVSAGLSITGTNSGIITAFRVRTPTAGAWDGFLSVPASAAVGAVQDSAAGSTGDKFLKVYVGDVLYTIAMVTA